MIINYESIAKYYVKTTFPSLYRLKEKYKRKKYAKMVTESTSRRHAEYEATGRYPTFNVIEIETINRCNNVCSFCPVNKNSDVREYKRMTEKTFLTILTQLKDMNYTGTVHLYSNNEPFLDERITDFARITKENLPACRLAIFSNGILLTVEKFKEIMKYLDRLVIDNYNDRLKLITPVKNIYEFAKQDSQYKDRLRIRLRKINDVLYTRGGQAPNRLDEQIESLPFGCLLPFRQMVVRPDGKVSLCCNDALGKITMGDITNDTIASIWNNANYLTLRKKILQGRSRIPLCEACDSQL